MSTEKPVFTKEAEDLIFKTARAQVLRVVFRRGETPDFYKELGEWAETSVLGTFVSFKKNGQLRSCMGWMRDGVPLADALQSSAVSAAREDPRFPPLSAAELPELTMEVWVLWGMEEVVETGDARISAFEIGRHGLQISASGRRGLLLPGVAVEYNMSPRQFLEAVCQKAGLARDAWRNPRTNLSIFEGLAIERPFYDEEVARFAESNPVSESDSYDVRNFGWNLGPLVIPAAPAHEEKKQDLRPAAVAGMFYPGGAEQKRMLDLFAAAVSEEPKTEAAAVMVPHAGWVYSGELAYRTLAGVKFTPSVVVLAPKHRPEGVPWGIAPHRVWDFGTGRLESDLELAEGIARAVPKFRLDAESHRREHAIEVLLPMIARLAPETKVVGMVLSYGNEEELFQGARQFAEFYKTLETPPLLIVSSDMNHYENEERTQTKDRMALDALETLDPARLCRVVAENGITMCGVQPAAFALETLKQCGTLHSCRQIGHMTSGKASGDFNHVVGYAGYTFC